MFTISKKNIGLILLSIMSLLIGSFSLYSWSNYQGIPARESLLPAEGIVDWVQRERYGIKFKLSGSSLAFDYASKGRAMGLVYKTLSRKDRPTVAVLYNLKNPSGPIYSKKKYYSVFELSANGKVFRSHAEIEEAWASDETIALWIGTISIFLCIIFLIGILRGAPKQLNPADSLRLPLIF